MSTKICRVVRIDIGAPEDPAQRLAPEGGGEAPSSYIHPDEPPKVGNDGLLELWYWDAPFPDSEPTEYP